MADLMTIIQMIMKCQKNNDYVIITSKGDNKIIGQIEDYDGQMLTIKGEIVDITSIVDIEKYDIPALAEYIMKRITIVTLDKETIDAVLISADASDIAFITDKGQGKLSYSQIEKMVFDKSEIFRSVRSSADVKVLPVPDGEKNISDEMDVKSDTESVTDNNDESIVDDVDIVSDDEKQKVLVKTGDMDEYVPNDFEKALIEGKKASVEKFVTNDHRLMELGYTEEEIDRIKKMIKTISWGKDPNRVATRIYGMQLNKNGLANYYFKLALDASEKGSEEYKKALNSLVQFIADDAELIQFWKKHYKHLKDNSAFCERYIEAQCHSKGIIPNNFEKTIIEGDKVKAHEYTRDTTKLAELGYTEDEIERIGKTFKNLNWDSGWYRIATRLYGLQVNLHNLAEIYYEAALIITNKKAEEYSKIINVLATIKINADASAYVAFFKTYKEKLKPNSNYVIAYANALLSLQNMKQVEKDMPMFEEQLINSPVLLERLRDEIEYYKTAPSFSLNTMPNLLGRYSNEDDRLAQERSLIDKLPEKKALKALLEIYSSEKEEEIYFELANYALFFIKEDRPSMQKLCSMLLDTDNIDAVCLFLPRIPVLWCDSRMLKKYALSNKIDNNDSSSDMQKWFTAHIMSVGMYKSFNAFEIAIINNDKAEITNYIHNPALLEELGYSEDEIQEILAVDIEAKLSDDIYTMRRILAFQGNKNNTAERFLFEAYYTNKIDMCNRLFPLLIEARRGELILALFEYDPKLRKNMASLERIYYLAFCMVEKDDDKFFACMEDCWSDYPEDEILDRMISIAQSKGDNILLKQLELQKQMPRGNEFEAAIIDGDNDTIRKYVKNANLLVELGYTPEEIQKINKAFAGGTGYSGTKPGQIANRVYYYQKNKNNLAEKLFLNALVEDSPEDSLADSRVLFQIYTSQRNYEMVYKIYEEYLAQEMEEKFNRSYASTYGVALFEMEKYDEFLAFVKDNISRWPEFSLSTFLLYVSYLKNTNEFDDFIWKNLTSKAYRPDIVAKYLISVASDNAENMYSDTFANLFNMFFVSMTDSDILEIADVALCANKDRFMTPQGALLAAFASPTDSDDYVVKWLKFMTSDGDDNHKIDVILQLVTVLPLKINLLTKYAIELYSKIQKTGVADYKKALLEECIYDNLLETDYGKEWCDVQKAALSKGEGTLQSLHNYMNILMVLDLPKDFWKVYLAYKKNSSTVLLAQTLFDIVVTYYDKAKEKISSKIQTEILEELISLTGEFDLDYVSCQKMVHVCNGCGRNFEASIYNWVLGSLVSNGSTSNDAGNYADLAKDPDYLSYLYSILINDPRADLENMKCGWSKYVAISEEDELIIGRLRNTIKTADLWAKNEINTLAKTIICEPTNIVNWQLFEAWILTQDVKSKTVLGAIIYQLSSLGGKSPLKALKYAIENDLKTVALELLLKSLDTNYLSENISAQKSLRVMIDKGWFKEASFREEAVGIIKKIGNNISLQESVDYEWNSVCMAVDLAVVCGEYKTLLELFADYLSKECAKQCCVIIANMILSNNYTYADKAFSCLDSSIADVPYKALIHDLYEKSKNEALTEAEKKVLECVQYDHGNTLGINDLLSFYCEMSLNDECMLGLEVITILMKYTQDDPVLHEVAALLLKNCKVIDEEQYYKYMFEYLETSRVETPIEYAVGQMICGENYLRGKGIKVESFRHFIEERYPRYLDSAKAYQEFCDSIVVKLRTTQYEDFSGILQRAVFTGDWESVFEYRPEETVINSVLIECIKTERLNIADDYYRSIIRSTVRFVLNHITDMWDIVESSKRLNILWDNLGNVGCGYEFFSGLLQQMPDECISELKSIWSLDIETLTIFKKFFGNIILQQDNCEKYALLFSVFINARSGDFFSSKDIQEQLGELDGKKAFLVCKNYEQLYIRPSGPTFIYATKKYALKDSDYENNVFSAYLKKNDLNFYSLEERYLRFKKKYELIVSLYGISSYNDANDKRFDLNTKRQIYSIRSLYYYYAILSNNSKELKAFKNSYAEVINAVTVALSDDTYASDLNVFISRYGVEERNALGIIILAEQERIDDAAKSAIDKVTGPWQAYLCARLVAAYGRDQKDNSYCQECLKISRKSKIQNTYWIKNFKHAKSLSDFDPEIYFADIYISEQEDNDDTVEANKTIDVRNDEGAQRDILDTVTVDVEDIEDYADDIPAFVSVFLNQDFTDEGRSELKAQWLQVQKAVDSGKESQDELNNCAIKIGISMLKANDSELDEGLMTDVFGLIRKYSIQDIYLITALHDILEKYICNYSSLDLLAESVSNHRNVIIRLGYEQEFGRKTRTAEDINAAGALVDILINIANDLSSAMGDESIKERLQTYQKELNDKTRRNPRFRKAVSALGKMIQGKINSINYVPYLVVSHLGAISNDSYKNYNWKETWKEGATFGNIRGVVLNRGGAPAKNVTLSVMVNSEHRETLFIGEITPGRKIPFSVKYSRQDVVEEEVSWSATATYLDVSNNNELSSNAHGTVKVNITTDQWDMAFVGREKFNTQFAAEGDEFCGRTNELLKLNNLYNATTDVSRYPSLLVTGLRRAGKSSVIKFFKEMLRKRDNLAPIFVDAQGINGDITNAFFNLVFTEVYRLYRKEIDGFVEFKKRWEEVAKQPDWISQLPGYFMELSELLGGRKVVFILDEMENVFYSNHFSSAQNEEQFFGMIRSIIQNYQEYVSFIFCGSDKLLTSCLEQKRESQMFQVLQRIFVGRMGISDIRDMFEKYNNEYSIKFGDDAIEAIMYYTNGLIWYTKVIAYNILDRIVDQEHIIRDEIHVADVDAIVELLINGDLGSELIDLLDNNFGARRKAIIRAMARATKFSGDSVTTEMISAELSKINYIDDETGEVLGSISEDEMVKNLSVLERMDFIEKDARKENAYRFTAELYRLLMLNNRRIDKFVIMNGGTENVG